MALNIISKLNLDMKAPNAEVAYANQYDSTGHIIAQLLNDGEKWEVPSGAVGIVSYMKSDRIGGYYDSTALHETAVTFASASDRSVIKIALDAQVMTTVGNVSVQVNFYQSNQRLSTFTFILNVKASPITATNVDSKWFGNLLILSGLTVDDTLSIAGSAADAKTTGNLIAENSAGIESLEMLKVNKPLTSPNGTAGQLLKTLGDGNTEWTNQGTPTDAQVETAVSEWLDDHPEATTTVEDHSLTHQKLVIGTLNFVTPEMFGATGDGVTDDSIAIQNAINNGRPILFSSDKTYYVTTKLELLDNSYLVGGNNTIIKWSNQSTNTPKMEADGCDNIHLENLVFDVGEQDYDSSDISITNGVNIRILKCTFLNSYGTALRIHGISYSSIEECHFEDITGIAGNPGEAIYGMDFHDVEIIGCSCNHVGDHFLYADGYHDLYNVIVSNCEMNDTGNDGLTNGGAICTYNNVHNITISNCTIKPYGAGMNIGAHAEPLIGSHDVTISNCAIDGGTFGIVVGGISDSYPAYNVVIDGCDIKNSSVDGIRVIYAKHIIITNTVVDGAVTNGIGVDNFYDSIISNIILKNVKLNGVGLLIGSGRGTGICGNVTVTNIRAYTTLENQGAYSVYFRRGTEYIIDNIYDDGNFSSGLVYPANYSPPVYYSNNWTPSKSGGSYSGDITQVKSAQYTISGTLVYVYAEFVVDAEGTGYLTIAGLPNDLLDGYAFGGTIVSNTAKSGIAVIDARTSVNSLVAYFTDQNPVAASGNTIQVWVIGKKHR